MANTDTTLPPEVRHAMGAITRSEVCGDPIPQDAWHLLLDAIPRLAEENARLRETVKRLNRRVQVAEAGVAEKMKAAAPGSLGRALANAAASKAESELADVRRKWADAESKLAACDDDLRLVLAERDALKARIAEAPVAVIDKDGFVSTPPPSVPGRMRNTACALLPLDYEAKS